MENEKRLILAIILSMVVLIGYQYFFVKPLPPKPSPASTPAPAAAPSQGKPAVPAAPAPAPAEALPASTTVAPPPSGGPVIPTTVAEPETVTLDLPLCQVQLDNRGGVLRSVTLKKFIGDDQKGVELVPALPPEKYGSFFALRLNASPELEKELNERLFEVVRKSVDSPLGRADQVIFRFQRVDLTVEKQFTFFAHKPYQVEFACQIRYQGQAVPPSVQLGPGLTRHELVPWESYQVAPDLVYFDGDSANVVTGASINDGKEGSKTVQGQWGWAGVQTKFFGVIAIPRTAFPQLELSNRVWQATNPAKPESEPVNAQIVSVYVPVPPGSALPVYLGPKSYEILSAVREDLTKTIDFGWFSIIVKPLYYALRWIHQYINNWGWAIVVLTLLISIALFPIRFMQMKSMRDMQKIQPQMKAIQAKYKGSKSAEGRQKMNMVMMQLYKEAGVSPMGGCLPLLIQFPFLIAFYNLIDKSIELWKQPFIFWIKDLSIHDPYYITPVVMGLTMIIQMKQTPTPPGQDNKMQKQMMYIMPVVFTFFFLNMSSGLVVYFLFSNIFSWGLQKIFEFFMPEYAMNPRKDSKKKSAAK